MQKNQPKFGTVSLIGRPNVGKSTLFNKLVGAKLAIVSPKPQTTRNRITGILTCHGDSPGQIVFWDLPGIHKAIGVMNRRMVSIALQALDSVDLGIWVIDAKRESEIDSFVFKQIQSRKLRLILAINKIDLIQKDLLLPMIDEYRKAYDFLEVVPVSALKERNLDALLKCILLHLPEGDPLFPEDTLTDIPERSLVAELVREKVFLLTREEVPYSTAVSIVSFEEKEKLVSIGADIWVEKDSQKGILVGHRGEMIKKIGTMARIDIERLLGHKVFLDLSVKVKEGWREKSAILDELGIRA